MGFIRKWIARGRDFVQTSLTAPGDQLGRWARFFRFQVNLWKFCARRLRRNNSLAMSSALSFRTLFALVPILALSVVLMKSFGLWEQGQAQLFELLETAGLDHTIVVPVEEPAQSVEEPVFTEEGEQPATVETAPVMQEKKMTDVIMGIVERVQSRLTIGKVGPVGVALLIWAAVTLLTTLERSLNRIFGARSNRAIAQRFILYGSLITLWPVILTSAWYMGKRLQGLFVTIPLMSWMMVVVGYVAPFIVGLLFVTLVYKQLPNTRVSFRAAMGGALVTYPLWLVAKWAFGLYIKKVVAAGGMASLYGSMALLPVFLFWLNLTWTIVLFGAEVAHTGANLGKMQQSELAEKIALGPLDRLAAALVVADAFVQGQGAVAFDKLGSTLSLPDQSVQTLLEQLMTLKLVESVQQDHGAPRYILARPAQDVAVYDVVEFSNTHHPVLDNRQFDPRVLKRVEFVRDHLRQCASGMSLEEVIRKADASD